MIPVVLRQLFGLACGIIAVKWTSQLVPPEVLGTYGLFLTVVPIGAWVTHAGLLRHVHRHWARLADRAGYVRSLLRPFLRQAIWLAAAILIAPFALGGFKTSAFWWTLLPALVVANVGLVVAGIGQAALQANRRHWQECVASGIGSLTRSFLPLLVVLVAGASTAGMAAGFSVHAAGMAAVYAFLMARSARTKSPSARSGMAIPHSAGYLGAFAWIGLLSWGLSGMNRWIVAGFHGQAETGYFVLASSLALIVPQMAGGALIQYCTPLVFAGADRARSQEDWRNLARRVDLAATCFLAVSLAGVALLHLGAPLLVGTLIAPHYAASLPLLLPAGFSGAAVTVGLVYQMLNQGRGNSRACLQASLGSALLLVFGGLVAAAISFEIFLQWLIFSPVPAWITARWLSRRLLFRSSSLTVPNPNSEPSEC